MRSDPTRTRFPILRYSFCTLSVAALLLALAPATASAVTFSFASDDNDDGPTFVGNSGGSMPDDINEASAFTLDGVVNVDLMVDVNQDTAGGVTVFKARLFFAGRISNYGLQARGAGWVHSWDVEGEFLFADAGTGQPIFSVIFDNGLLTSASSNIVALGDTATLQTSEGVDPGILFTTYTPLHAIGILNLHVQRSEDFAFTFTNLRATPARGGGPARIDHGQFLGDWISEGSFSAHARPDLVVATAEPTAETAN
jgi:hypothetical protein